MSIAFIGGVGSGSGGGSSAVLSVAGKTGVVTLAVADVTDAVATSDSRLSDARTPTDGSVTTAKLADSAVTAAKVADGTLTNAKIASNQTLTPTAVATGAGGLRTIGTISQRSVSDALQFNVSTSGVVTNGTWNASAISADYIDWTAISEWQPSTAYAKGALVSYLGVGYRRSVAGTSGSTFNITNWQQITPSINVVGSPTSLSADQNDYALPAATDIVRIAGTAARNITGFVAGASGQAVLLINVGSFALTLKHQSTSSTAANRIIVPWAGDYVMAASGGAAMLVYDATDSRWRVI